MHQKFTTPFPSFTDLLEKLLSLNPIEPAQRCLAAADCFQPHVAVGTDSDVCFDPATADIISIKVQFAPHESRGPSMPESATVN